MQQKPVVGTGDVLGRDVAGERQFHFIGGVVALRDEPEAMGHTEDVGIDSQRRLAEGDALDDVRRLTAHTRQVEQQVHVRRYFALMFLHEHPRHPHQMVSLRVRVGDTADIF